MVFTLFRALCSALASFGILYSLESSETQPRAIYYYYFVMCIADIDECRSDILNMCVNAECINTNGSYLCNCYLGFMSNEDNRCKGTCMCYIVIKLSLLTEFYHEDVDECATGNYTCDENAECMNTMGSFSCECQRPYIRIDESCRCKTLHDY